MVLALIAVLVVRQQRQAQTTTVPPQQSLVFAVPAAERRRSQSDDSNPMSPAALARATAGAPGSVADSDNDSELESVSVGHMLSVLMPAFPASLESRVEKNRLAGHHDHDVDGNPRAHWRPALDDVRRATIWHMVKGHVELLTLDMQCSYVQHVRQTQVYAGHTGRAAAMLSYTWGDECADVFHALGLWCFGAGLQPGTTYVWICSLCINQHAIPEDLPATFKERVEKIGMLLPLLTPWDAPQYTKRLWCLFEFWTSINSVFCTVDCIFPPREVARLEDMSTYGNFGRLEEVALLNIDSKTAVTSYRKDTERIQAEISAVCGHSVVDAAVREHLTRLIGSLASVEFVKTTQTMAEAAMATSRPDESPVYSDPPNNLSATVQAAQMKLGGLADLYASYPSVARRSSFVVSTRRQDYPEYTDIVSPDGPYAMPESPAHNYAMVDDQYAAAAHYAIVDDGDAFLPVYEEASMYSHTFGDAGLMTNAYVLGTGGAIVDSSTQSHASYIDDDDWEQYSSTDDDDDTDDDTVNDGSLFSSARVLDIYKLMYAKTINR